MFVSSATPTNTLQRIISMRGWSGLFDGVMGSPDSKECHLRSILFSNHYSLSEVAYIGDSEIDQEAAIARRKLSSLKRLAISILRCGRSGN